MTEENEIPDRRNLLLGESANEALDKLADEYHDGNESAAVRDAIHFSAKWREKGKPLPAKLLHSVQSIEKSVQELTTRIETLENSVANAEAAASNAPVDEVDINRLKREVRNAISESGARQIESLAEELNEPIGMVRNAIEELEDDGKIRRVDDGIPPQYDLYE